MLRSPGASPGSCVQVSLARCEQKDTGSSLLCWPCCSWSPTMKSFYRELSGFLADLRLSAQACRVPDTSLGDPLRLGGQYGCSPDSSALPRLSPTYPSGCTPAPCAPVHCTAGMALSGQCPFVCTVLSVIDRRASPPAWREELIFNHQGSMLILPVKASSHPPLFVVL